MPLTLIIAGLFRKVNSGGDGLIIQVRWSGGRGREVRRPCCP